MKNRPSATGDLVAATPSQEPKGSRSSRKSQKGKGVLRLEPLCDLFDAVRGMVVLDEAKAAQFIRKDGIENTYVLDEKPFASGLFATVRRVRDKVSGVTYAAKYAARDRYGVDSTADIMHELGLLSVCAPCSRIVRLHAAFDTKSDLILVMDYASGGDMQTVLDTDIIPFEQDASRFTRQLMEALVFLHDRNIVHLDIKPQNLVLTGPFPDCDIKLCDLEISRVVTDDEQIREILGTPDYVAPEILHFEPISLAADIWSTGVLAYVLLTGFTPFGGDTDQETFCNISKCQIDFPNELFEDVSDIATDFIKRLLVRNPSDRPPARDCLRCPWLSQNKKGASHTKDTIASEAQRKTPLIHGGGCPRSSSSMQHLALQRNNLTKSREVLSDRFTSLTNLRKSTSKSRERLCEMRLSLSRSRDHLFDIQRAMASVKEGMGVKLLSRSQEVLSNKLNSLNNSTQSEGNTSAVDHYYGMSTDCIPPLISLPSETQTDPLTAHRGQGICESSEVLSQPLVEVPEEEDETQEKSETEINKDVPTDDAQKDDCHSIIQQDGCSNQSVKTDTPSVSHDKVGLRIEHNQYTPVITAGVSVSDSKSVIKHYEKDECLTGHENQNIGSEKSDKEATAAKTSASSVAPLISNQKVFVTSEMVSAEKVDLTTLTQKAVTAPVTIGRSSEKPNSAAQSLQRILLTCEGSGSEATETSSKTRTLDIPDSPKKTQSQSEVASRQPRSEFLSDAGLKAVAEEKIPPLIPFTRKTSRHEMFLKVDTPPSTPPVCLTPPTFTARNCTEREEVQEQPQSLQEPASVAVAGSQAPEEQSDKHSKPTRPKQPPPLDATSQIQSQEEQSPKNGKPTRPKRPPPLDVLPLSIPSVPSPETSMPDEPGTPRAYFLDKLRSFRDKLTQSIQRQNSDNTKPTSQPTSPLSEVADKPFIEPVPEEDQKIPAELLSRRRASWAHGLRQEVQPEQKPSVAQLAQAFVVTKPEPVTKGLSFIEPRKLRKEWRKSESTESLNEKPDNKPTTPEVRKLKHDWRKVEEEGSEKLETKVQEEEKPSKPVASIAMVFEIGTASQPLGLLAKPKVPLTPPIRRKNSFERSRPAHLMAEVTSLPKLIEVLSPREEEEPPFPPQRVPVLQIAQKIDVSPKLDVFQKAEDVTVKIEAPSRVEKVAEKVSQKIETASKEEKTYQVPDEISVTATERPKSQEIKQFIKKESSSKAVLPMTNLPQQSTSMKGRKGVDKKKAKVDAPARKKREKSQESSDVFSQTLDTDFSQKEEVGTVVCDNDTPHAIMPTLEDVQPAPRRARSGSVSSDTGCSELSSDALSDRSSTASAGNWEDGEKKTDKKTAETQTTSLEDVSEKVEWRGRNRSHSVQADLSFLAQPWGRICTGSVARAFEKFGNKSNEKSNRNFRVRRQSTIL